jgi:Flp pilus assembly protein TadG
VALGVFRPRRRTEKGAAALEFALVMLPLLYLVFGAIQYGWYFYSMQSGTSATADVVRRLTVGDCTDSTQRKNLLVDRLGAASSSAAALTNTVQYYQAGSSTPAAAGYTPQVGDGVKLTVTFTTANFNFPFIPIPDNSQVTRSVFGRVEDTTADVGGCQ